MRAGVRGGRRGGALVARARHGRLSPAATDHGAGRPVAPRHCRAERARRDRGAHRRAEGRRRGRRRRRTARWRGSTPTRAGVMPAARHRGVLDVGCRRRGARRSCGALSTRCAKECRSNAWPSCSATPSRYARLLHDHLELAGIAHNGVSVRTLADSVLGRSLLRLLALADDDFRREDVCAFMAGRAGARRSRPAGGGRRVGADLARGGCRGRRRAMEARGSTRYVAEPARTPPTTRARLGQRARTGTRRGVCSSFVAGLAADLDGAPASWSGIGALGARSRRPLDRRRGCARPRGRRSSRKRRAGSRPRSSGSEVSTRSRRAPTLDVFRRSLALELDAARDQVGRLGEGLLVGPAVLALGVELDRLWVCGLAEGVFPAAPRDDPLAGRCGSGRARGRDAVAERPYRRRSPRLARRAREHRRALGCSASPRGDLRRNTEHVPSRFLLDTVESLTGARPLGSALPLARAWWTTVPSFVHGLTHAAFPPTRHELEVRAALAARAVDRRRSRPRARHGARARARRSRRVHPVRREPRASEGAHGREEPGRVRCRGVGDPAPDVDELSARLFRALPAERRARSNVPRRSCRSRRSTRGA